jgi:hypothetical protein
MPVVKRRVEAKVLGCQALVEAVVVDHAEPTGMEALRGILTGAKWTLWHLCRKASTIVGSRTG